MSETEAISIVLDPETTAKILAAVRDGRYSTPSDVVRAAVRTWRSALPDTADDLRRMIADGIESGPGVDADLVFDALMERYTPTTR